MKNLMKVISVLLLIALVAILIPMITTDIDADFTIFLAKIIYVLKDNYLGIIAIALCCYCLERNDSNYFARIIPFYMCGSIFISIVLRFFFFEESVMYDLYGSRVEADINSILVFFCQVRSFIENTQLYLVTISILFIVKPSNQISIIIKRTAYALIAVNLLLNVWIIIKKEMEEKLPNVYNYEGYDGKGFNFTSLSSTQNLANKIYQISLVSEAFAIILLFTTNYAFSSSITIDADEIDYEAIKSEANQYAQNQIKEKYSLQKQETQQIQQNYIPREDGLMNINNQLGANSNVGEVSTKAIETNIENNRELEYVLPVSGPVINETVPTAPVNTVEQNQQLVQQPIQQTPQQTIQVQQPIQQMPQQTMQVQQPIQQMPQQNMQVQQVQQESVQQIPQQPMQPQQNNVEVLPDEVIEPNIEF